jgi:alkanesulfonate monooxygenase SsuD/methylene tetrahydromethanopterin reductase-like flavin-dependent oxidoreductase (luciferase family)
MRAHFLPRPLQTPRIPVWIAGYWPHKVPFRRAARWDGVFPLGLDSPSLSPVAIREICTFIHTHRTEAGPFDFVVTGVTRAGSREDTDRTVAAFEAGATWWLDWLDGNRGSFERIRDRVLQGPPRA